MRVVSVKAYVQWDNKDDASVQTLNTEHNIVQKMLPLEKYNVG
jgi:hypothetical protein